MHTDLPSRAIRIQVSVATGFILVCMSLFALAQFSPALAVSTSPHDAGTKADLVTTTASLTPTAAIGTATPTSTRAAANTATPTASSTASPTRAATQTATPTQVGSPTLPPSRTTSTPIATNTPSSTPTRIAAAPTPLQQGTPTPTPFATVAGLGIERYWTYKSFALSDRVTLYVNLWNGNLVAQYNETSIPSRGLPITLIHTYNSLITAWTHSLDEKTWENSNEGELIWYDGDGTQHHFDSIDAINFTPPPGRFETITMVGTKAVMTFADQNVHHFPGGPAIGPDSILDFVDRQSNTITLTHASGLLTKASAAGGQVLTFTNASGALSTVNDDAGNTFQYGYVGGMIKAITDSLSLSTQFSYTNGFLNSVTDPRTFKSLISYDGSNRVTAITISNTQVATFTYGSPTVFVDGNNNSTSYYINSTGQVTKTVDPLGNATAYVYDSNYEIIQSVDALNRTSKARFDSNGNVLSQTNALNQTTLYTYNNTNDLLTVTDALNRPPTRYKYDSLGNAVLITNSMGYTRAYTYNAFGQQISAFDGKGNKTTFEYSPAGYLITTTDALLNKTVKRYDIIGNKIRTTDALGFSSTYRYDAANHVISVTLPVTIGLNATTHYSYDSVGNSTVVTDARGFTTTLSFSALNQITLQSDALGNNTRFQYDPLGNRTVTTDALGNIIRMRYDADNRLISTTVPLTVGISATTLSGYDQVGNNIVVTDARGFASSTVFDAINRPVSEADALGHSTQYAYDAVSNRIVITNALGAPTRYGFDPLNRTTVITDALANTIQYQYNAVDNRTVITDALSNPSSLAYDALNRVISTTTPLTGTQTALTQFKYDPVGNRTVITDARGYTSTYGYDAARRMTSQTDALLNTTKFAYDLVGNRTVITDASGFTTTYTFDGLSRLSSTTNAAGNTQTSYYDAVGNRISATDELGHLTIYAYDQAHRLVATTDPLTQTTVFAFDAVGNLTRLTGPKTSGITVTFDITYTYDAVNRPTAKQTLIGTTGYAYDNVGNLLTLTDPTGAYSTFSYDTLNRIVRQDDHAPGGSLNVSTTLSYDANSNPTNKTEWYPTFTRSTSHTYDKANRLVSDSAPGGTTTYTYDTIGNRIAVADPLGVTTVITPNQVNLPIQTAHKQNSTLLDLTTTNFDSRSNLMNRITLAAALTLTEVNAFGPNNYLSSVNTAQTGGVVANALAYTATLYANNLVSLITGTDDLGSYPTAYDSSNRVRCYTGWFPQPAIQNDVWTYNADGNRKAFYHSNLDCPATEFDAINLGALTVTRTYTYEGQKLIRRDGNGGGDHANVANYSYDGAGNLIQEQRVDSNATPPTTTVNFDWTWQQGATRLTTLTDTSGVTNTFNYDSLGRIIHRSKACGYSDYTYEGDSDRLLRETWYNNTSGNTFDLVRYYYINGRPVRVDIANYNTPPLYCPFALNSYYTYLMQYDWHGNVVTHMLTDGSSNVVRVAMYTAWGMAIGQNSWVESPYFYYRWNAAHGYLFFQEIGLSENNQIGLQSDPGLYYVHGRWYSTLLGRFLSPNGKGDYLYNGDGNDALNYANGCANLPRSDSRYAGPPVYGQPEEYSFNPGEAEYVGGPLKSKIIASAQRHNTSKSNMDDNAFAALIASIIRWEGKLPGTGLSDQEQRKNQLWDQADLWLGFNLSAGLAKIKPSVAIEILRGYTPGGSDQHFCYDIAGAPDWNQEQWFAANDPYISIYQIIAWDLQDPAISLEFLAANLERGADRVTSKGFPASAWNLAMWHNNGRQTPAELLTLEDPQRFGYGNNMVRTIPAALQILFDTRVARYLPYSSFDKPFIGPEFQTVPPQGPN